jgi:hypothetical protein
MKISDVSLAEFPNEIKKEQVRFDPKNAKFSFTLTDFREFEKLFI